MADWAQITRDDVLRAIGESDALGREAFLETYGFGPAPEYVLVHGEGRYDSKAVVGVAYGYATGHTLGPEEFSGGKDGAAAVLRGLGFDVEGPDLPRLPYTSAATVGLEHARATWALAARERLAEVAATYHETISVTELADYVQRRSLIRSSHRSQQWMGDVLARVSAECARRGEPFLSALCVDARGRVGASYAVAVEQHRGASVPDPDEHAARERLECHRRFGAVLPPGGGVPAMPAVPATATARRAPAERVPGRRTAAGTGAPSSPGRTRSAGTSAAKPRKPAAEPKPLQTCPVHFTVLPASGVCDLCE